MAIEATTRNHELETLRIERPQEQPRRKRSRLISRAMLMVLATVLGAAGYARECSRRFEGEMSHSHRSHANESRTGNTAH